MFRIFRQTNLIRFSNLIHFKRQSSSACAPTASDLTETIMDYTNFVKLIGTVTDCHPIDDGYLYTVQVDNSPKNQIIEHKLNISTRCANDMALSMLKNRQRVNVTGYLRSHRYSTSERLSINSFSDILAGCPVSIVPKKIQLSDDQVDYTDKCIAMLQGHVRSDLQCDEDSCKFVLETKIAKRNELGDIIDTKMSTYHLIIIKEPELRKNFEETIRKYDDVMVEGYIDYHSLNSEAVGAVYPYKYTKFDRIAMLARASEYDENDDYDDDHYNYYDDDDSD